MSYEKEDVLVVPADLLIARRIGQGYHYLGDIEEGDRLLDYLLTRASFSPRHLVEDAPSLKQLIPYVVYEYGVEGMESQIFRYTRTKMQGEQRLHGKVSIGVGGHIRDTDGDDDNCMSEYYWNGVQREMAEEIDSSQAGHISNHVVAVINDDSDPVGRVHLGMVHICRVERPMLTTKEPSMTDAGFEKLSDLIMGLRDRNYEGWTRLAIQGLAAQHGIV